MINLFKLLQRHLLALKQTLVRVTLPRPYLFDLK